MGLSSTAASMILHLPVYNLQRERAISWGLATTPKKQQHHHRLNTEQKTAAKT